MVKISIYKTQIKKCFSTKKIVSNFNDIWFEKVRCYWNFNPHEFTH